MDSINKYLHFNHEGKNVYEIVNEMKIKCKSQLFVIKKVR